MSVGSRTVSQLGIGYVLLNKEHSFLFSTIYEFVSLAFKYMTKK